MKQITEADILGYVTSYRAFRGTPVDLVEIAYATSATMLAELLSPEWMRDNVLTGRSSNFFRPESRAGDDGYKRLDRVFSLADVLFNLQTVPGAATRFKQMLTTNVEALVGELEAAKLLAKSGFPVRFVDDVGATEPIYDVDTRIGTYEVKCETKCKLEATSLSTATILNALNVARRQVPQSAVGAVFVKIPESWVRDPLATDTIMSALASFFRNTKRISFVTFHWEKWDPAVPQGATRATAYRNEHNPRAAAPLKGLEPLFYPRGTSWRDLMTLLRSAPPG